MKALWFLLGAFAGVAGMVILLEITDTWNPYLDSPDAVVDTLYADPIVVLDGDSSYFLNELLREWFSGDSTGMGSISMLYHIRTVTPLVFTIDSLNERVEWWANLLCMSGKILPPKSDPCSGMVSVAAVDSLFITAPTMLWDSAGAYESMDNWICLRRSSWDSLKQATGE